MFNERNSKIKRLKAESSVFRAISELVHKLEENIPMLKECIVSRIDFSDDRSVANVYIFSENGEDFVNRLIGEIIPYVKSMRMSLCNMVSMRRVPLLRFFYDQKEIKVRHIEKLLDSIKE
jgi:ribosome-binding factor A